MIMNGTYTLAHKAGLHICASGANGVYVIKFIAGPITETFTILKNK